MRNQNPKVLNHSQKQQEFDANFQVDTKVKVSSQKQTEFDANFVGEMEEIR